MATETTHASELDDGEKALLGEVAKGSFSGGDVGRLEELDLVMRDGESWVITDEGKATLRTHVKPDHPLT